MRATIVAVLVGVVALAASNRTVFAQGGFFTSPPAPLSPSHASIDGPSHCNDCHINGTKALSNRQCLNCHDHQNLDQRISTGKGFHAKPGVAGRDCQACHHEHRPGVDIMGWSSVAGGQDKFDHKLTDWPLDGKHAQTACADCHKDKNKSGLRTFMGTANTCSACHLKEQPHKVERKILQECERCHNASTWKTQKWTVKQFDHDDQKFAVMPLLGGHKPLPCARCHVKAVFNLPADKPAACGNAGCHAPRHQSKLFDNRPCDWCHSPTFAGFKVETLKEKTGLRFFDHTQYARFDLGKHETRVKCYGCHTAALGDSKPGIPCESCHAKDNRHGDRFKAFGAPQPRCGTCHPTTTWKTTVFNHAQTKFPLTAKHAAVTCRACHRGKGPTDFENFNGDASCKGCHQHRTVHADAKHPTGYWESNKCLKCHARPGDRALRARPELEKEFHGLSSDFPLIKKHKGIDCALCHKGRDFAKTTTFSDASPECGDRCHEDSLHKGSLGKKCTPCHTSGIFTPALAFDHQQPFPDGTSFQLRGEHLNNKCEDCHPKRQYKGTPQSCGDAACHLKDDAHKGRLGTECGQCHLENRDIIFNHNKQSAFRLDGKHLETRCVDCHPTETFKPRPTTCFGCHPEPAVHKGSYGTTCEQCHTTRTFDDVKPLHDVGDFALRGMHNNIACERCHRDNRPLAGSGNLCINCHRQDDIHNNSLSPRCGECHTQWTFAPARFDHMRVGCNLTGLHRTLSCFGCHKNGNFSGIVPTCRGCHVDDAVRVGQRGGVDHPAQVACATCHNPNTWLPAMGNAASGRDSVCR